MVSHTKYNILIRPNSNNYNEGNTSYQGESIFYFINFPGIKPFKILICEFSIFFNP